VQAARAAKGKRMEEKIADEIISSANETGAVYKKKIDLHRMAEANRSYAHLRW